MNKLKCELYFVNSQNSSSARLAFARYNHERLTDSNTAWNHPLQCDQGPNSAVTTTKLHPLWQDATSWIKIAMLLLHELEHCLEPKDCGSNSSAFVCWVRVTCRSFMSFYAKSKLVVCIRYLTGQLASLKNMTPAVHGETPIIEGNSMYLELEWVSIHNLAVAPPSEGFGTLISAHSSKLDPIGH